MKDGHQEGIFLLVIRPILTRENKDFDGGRIFEAVVIIRHPESCTETEAILRHLCQDYRIDSRLILTILVSRSWCRLL